jgi:hypothetical protein
MRWAVLAVVALALLAPPARGASGVEELVAKAAQNQGLSLYARDRCRYEQRLLMERFEYDLKKKETGKLIAKRQTTVVVEPASQPDETGMLPVVTKVVADTDDKGEPKEKVDPNAKTGLASGAFLDVVFFPLLPENVEHLAFEEVASEAQGERWIKFAPRQGAAPPRPLVAGLAQLDATTGEVLTIRVYDVVNLKALDKYLEKVESFTAVVDYSQFGGKYRMPTAAQGAGVSNVNRFKGYFKFLFEEGKYAPVMSLE